MYIEQIKLNYYNVITLLFFVFLPHDLESIVVSVILIFHILYSINATHVQYI